MSPSQPDAPVWKSYVWHDGRCFFVSTIERNYDTYQGLVRGKETLVFTFNWAAGERGHLLHQASGIADHAAICRCLLSEGVVPNEENPTHAKYFRAAQLVSEQWRTKKEAHND